MTDPTHRPRSSGSEAQITFGPIGHDAAASTGDLAADLTEILRNELGHAMVAVTALRNEVAAIGATVRRIEARLEQLAPHGTVTPAGGELVRADGEGALTALEQRLLDVNDRAAQDILDAILAVAQHLEAVQTATSWTLMRELRTEEQPG